jgi:hypothetical protein
MAEDQRILQGFQGEAEEAIWVDIGRRSFIS